MQETKQKILDLRKKRPKWFVSFITRFGIARVLAMSFASVILIGSLLLSLPVSVQGKAPSYLDSLFISTSAVCVTGLSPLTVADTYTFFGKTVMILLMEIGGLGLMTFVAAAIILQKKSMSLTERVMFASAAGKGDVSNIADYLKKIIKYTFFFQSIGFLLLLPHLIRDFGIGEGIFNSLFLCVSAFTNAGFDCFASNSLMNYASDPLVSLTVMGLITMGGLGFMVWFDLSRKLHEGKRKQNLHSFWISLSTHTKVVLSISLILFVSGTVFFCLAEMGNPSTLASLPVSSRILISMFQSVTLRTAGFYTVNIGACRQVTLLIMCVFMLIGGSPGGTAGGMKTTTAAILAVAVKNLLHDEGNTIHIWKRRIQDSDFIHAFIIFSVYIGFLFAATAIMLCTDGRTMDTLDLIYEEVSAIATVGLSAGLTPLLSPGGKIVIILLMFIGRVGPLAIIEVFQNRRSGLVRKHVEYPDADLMIG